MEFFIRFILVVLNIVAMIIEPIVVWLNGEEKKKIPAVKNPLINLSANDVIARIRHGTLKSEEIVQAYIDRIKEVNPYLNAVIEDRYEEAIKDARRADKMIEIVVPEQRGPLFSRYPLLGLPFTVKESCALKGMSQVVGNIHRKDYRANDNGKTVELLRSAGAIPLLVSGNPEFCLSWETSTHIFGKVKNPFDTRRTPGGSSGGEGALIGAAASLFGVGSDIAGSIRIPALYNGIFGHKPTGHLMSIKGHFPNSADPDMARYLQVGPMTRFAQDLPILTAVMAGDDVGKLDLTTNIQTKDIKIFYMDSNGFTLTHKPVDFDIRLAILKSVAYFEKCGCRTERANIKNMSNAIEISMSTLLTLKDIPSVLVDPKGDPNEKDNIYSELLKNFIGKPKYTYQALFLELFMNMRGFMSEASIEYWRQTSDEVRDSIIKLLGDDGVLLFPTFHRPAPFINTSIQNLAGVGFVAIVNSCGLPATHIPMGLNKDGLPIGFQVIAAPYKDKLCMQIAAELESAFGGWVPPYSA